MHHHVTRLLPYSAEQVFQLVGDVQSYPDFVPWITSMRVDGEIHSEAGVITLDTDASVGFRFLQERFRTRVVRDPACNEITVTLISGPFRRLFNSWRFHSHPVGCEVEFDIDFAFKSRMLELIFKANFGLAVDRLIACFEARARKLYATNSGAALTPVDPPAFAADPARS